MTQPRILFLSNVAPVGPVFGSRLRTNQTIRLLQQLGGVSIALMSRDEWDQSTPGDQAHYDLAMVARLLPAPTKGVAATLRRELDPTVHGGARLGACRD